MFNFQEGKGLLEKIDVDVEKINMMDPQKTAVKNEYLLFFAPIFHNFICWCQLLQER